MTYAKVKEISNLTVGVSYVCMLVCALWPLHAPCVLLMYARLYVSCSEMLRMLCLCMRCLCYDLLPCMHELD